MKKVIGFLITGLLLIGAVFIYVFNHIVPAKDTPTLAVPPAATSSDATPSPSPTSPPPQAEKPKPGALSLAFAGDVLLGYKIEPLFQQKGTDYVLNDTQSIFDAADVAMVNLENPLSTRGTAAQDKQYTFRARPETAAYLKEAGIDIVTLANNHVLDYGKDALLDTLESLQQHGIKAVGAGRDVDSASRPLYVEKNGYRIAFLGSSRVIPVPEWAAQLNQPGVATTYDPLRLTQEIQQARSQADLVIVYVHWGKERKETPEKYQQKLAHAYIDAGADAVIGSHPHVLQGFEFYKEKLIAYSLGNFVFNNSQASTAILQIHSSGGELSSFQIIPCEIKNSRTMKMKDKTKIEKLYDKLTSLSFHVRIDAVGNILPS